MNKKFGKRVNCTTTWNLFSCRHTTVFDHKKIRKGYTHKDVKLYIKAFLEGNRELRGRLEKANRK